MICKNNGTEKTSFFNHQHTHQQVLCAKHLKMNYIMGTVTKTTNFTCESAFNHCKFVTLEAADNDMVK
jgi:hypothetical protein